MTYRPHEMMPNITYNSRKEPESEASMKVTLICYHLLQPESTPSLPRDRDILYQPCSVSFCNPILDKPPKIPTLSQLCYFPETLSSYHWIDQVPVDDYPILD